MRLSPFPFSIAIMHEHGVGSKRTMRHAMDNCALQLTPDAAGKQGSAKFNLPVARRSTKSPSTYHRAGVRTHATQRHEKRDEWRGARPSCATREGNSGPVLPSNQSLLPPSFFCPDEHAELRGSTHSGFIFGCTESLPHSGEKKRSSRQANTSQIRAAYECSLYAQKERMRETRRLSYCPQLCVRARVSVRSFFCCSACLSTCPLLPICLLLHSVLRHTLGSAIIRCCTVKEGDPPSILS